MLIGGLQPALAALLVGLLLDAWLGDPPWLWRRLPHPVAVIGATITALERHLLRPGSADVAKRGAGLVLVVAIVVAAAAIGLALHAALAALPGGVLVEGLLIGILLAWKCLARHVKAVAQGLRSGLASGRAAVSHIVGRDPQSLDEAGVARAAIESLAENLADGVVAPTLWALLLGLPGVLAYKAINTADSMIGHRSERYRAFGWAAARLDDLVNLPASRLAAVLLVVAAVPAGTMSASLRATCRDAPLHRSPNAGWPEAAMAGALGLRLAGPRRYGGMPVEDAWMGDGRSAAGPADIARALALAGRAHRLLIVLVGLGLMAALAS